MSTLAELDTSLQALLTLKAPGVTKSRIAAITTLCVENVKSESVLVQKIFTHFKRAPSTHKLGVLYVVDAVTRQWMDRAGVLGQNFNTMDAVEGTFAAGVNKMTELLPVMMNDLIMTAPPDQHEKIVKLLDIWERGNIFPLDNVTDFKAKMEAQKHSQTKLLSKSTHPELEPNTIPNAIQPIAASQAASHEEHTREVLSSSTGIDGRIRSVGNAYDESKLDKSQPLIRTTVPPPSVAMYNQTQPGISAEQAQALAAVIPAHVANDPTALQAHLQLLQQLVQYGVPPDQWITIIEAMRGPSSMQTLPVSHGSAIGGLNSDRGRSRSPQHRHLSPSHNSHDTLNLYRQRSPHRSGSPSVQTTVNSSSSTRWLEYDNTLPNGSIRVLSRTLFIGGTQCNEDELRSIFSPFGSVQTCIPNPEKRHAFIKYTSRAGAVNAKEQMSNITEPSLLHKVRSVRWGVGFGPRDCSDYSTGVSVIPIERLTEADRKWVLTAPFGGSGGTPIKTGLVIEEPDIEIGAGVSSKAISKRVDGGDVGRARGQQDRYSRRPNPSQRSHSPQQLNVTFSAPRYEIGLPVPVPGYSLTSSTSYQLPQGQGSIHYG